MRISLNPCRGLPNQREVWAWGMYDLANQSFTLLVNTLLFAVYFKEVVVGTETVAAAARADRIWGAVVSVSMLVVVLSSPLVGALADGRGWKKRMLMGTGLVCAGFTCAFGLIGPGDVLLAIALYIPANIAYQLGENFLASFLPEIATQRTMGRVSAIGWTMGYVGALALLIIVVIANLGLGWKDTTQFRPLLVFAGLWFLGGMIAPAIVLREAPALATHGAGSAFAEAHARVMETLRSAKQYRQLVRFLTAFFIYGMGVQTVIFFAAIIAKGVVFTDPATANLKLFLFAAQMTVMAGVSAAATIMFIDRIGAKLTILVYLLVWIAGAGGLAAYQWTGSTAQWQFWIIGGFVGVGLGGIGAASRAMVGRFTPKHKTAEFFGLWGMTYKLAAVVGVFVFSQVKAGLGDTASLLLLMAYFAGGLALLLRVGAREGLRAARRAERDIKNGA